MPTHSNLVFARLFNIKYFLTGWMMIILCLLSAQSFSQSVDVVNPVTKVSTKLPDVATLQSAADVQQAISSAETEGKTLAAIAETEMTKSKSAEADLTKATTLNNTYQTGLTNFGKNDVAKYNIDLTNYTAEGTRFNTLLGNYNKAAQANNALPAKDRKAATVADLNKQKAQLDAQGIKLTQWKTRLDAAIVKLDAQKAALAKQKAQADAAALSATNKLKASAGKLKNLSDQLTTCAGYNEKCRALLVSKFNNTATPDTGYFSTPAYKTTLATLTANLQRLKQLPGIM